METAVHEVALHYLIKHHNLQGLGLLAFSDLPVRLNDPSTSSVVNLYLSFL
jgi:hypothetical protein